jgi:SAM-dependent methyltransferase
MSLQRHTNHRVGRANFSILLKMCDSDCRSSEGVASSSADRGAVNAFVQALLARAANLRLPALFGDSRQGAVYQLRERNGISAVMLETGALTEDEQTTILRFRLAQYLASGFADARRLFAADLDHEPRSSLSRSDYHVIVGSARDGEVLCYMTVRSAPAACPGERMRSHRRRPFPVEEMHGIGIYSRLAELPEIPVTRIREIGRFVKNQRLHIFDELGVRAPLECLLALIRTMTGPLRSEVDALVGEIEEDVVKRNLDFFHVPTVMIRGTVSYEKPSFLCGHLGRTFYPFALSISDFADHALPRTAAIEKALESPGKKGVLELLALKRTASPVTSRFEPVGGLPPLVTVEVPHADLPMAERWKMRCAGERLRKVSPFDRLTSAEATVLRTFMVPGRQNVGDVIIEQGQPGDALVVTEEGEADIVSIARDGTRTTQGRRGPGTCCGETAVVLGIAHSFSLVARTPMSILRLASHLYRFYLATIPVVDAGFRSLAVSRLATDLTHESKGAPMSASVARFEFSRVDEADDPQAFVGYLDRINQAIQGHKALSLRELNAKEGDVLLDVGCGPGDDTRALAALVGAGGRVTGIDASEAMIAEARRRAAEHRLAIEYHVADAHRLPFPDAAFDGSRTERVLQHLSDPRQALRELARVTRPGGLIVVGPDPDWETLTIDCPGQDRLRRVRSFLCDSLKSGGVAHQTRGHMVELGLENITVTVGTVILSELAAAEAMLDLSAALESARDASAITADEHADIIAQFRERDVSGRFFLALTGFVTKAQKGGLSCLFVGSSVAAPAKTSSSGSAGTLHGGTARARAATLGPRALRHRDADGAEAA